MQRFDFRSLVSGVVFVLFGVLFDLLETVLVLVGVFRQTEQIQFLTAQLVFQLRLLDPRVYVTETNERTTIIKRRVRLG